MGKCSKFDDKSESVTIFKEKRQNFKFSPHFGFCRVTFEPIDRTVILIVFEKLRLLTMAQNMDFNMQK